MPAEHVYGIQHMAVPHPGASPEPTRPGVPLVDVRWNREGGYVQVVTKETDPHGGRLVGDELGAHVTDGYFVELDRAAVNKLIRNLRRARDQAFGRDE